jgi:hypothetical protein
MPVSRSEAAHSRQAPESNWQRKDPGSSDDDVNAALSASTSPEGPELIETEGAFVSICHFRSEAGPTTPAESRPRTTSVCSPSARPLAEYGDAHSRQLLPSNRH